MIESIAPITLALFTRVLKWNEMETQVFIAKVRNEFKDPSRHLFVNCHFICGRKSGGGGKGWEMKL
jgi:hypothetical protein